MKGPTRIATISIVSVAIATYLAWRWNSAEAGWVFAEPSIWILTACLLACGLISARSRNQAVLPQLGLVPVLASFWFLPAPAAVLPAIAFSIGSRGRSLWGGWAAQGWGPALTTAGLALAGGELVERLPYSPSDSVERFVWILLLQLVLCTVSVVIARIDLSRAALRSWVGDLSVVPLVWLLGLAFQPTHLGSAIVAVVCLVGGMWRLVQLEESEPSSIGGVGDWGGLTGLRSLLHSLGAESSSTARFRALERACRKLLDLERFEILLFDAENATGLSVHRSDGDAVDERPAPLDSDLWPLDESPFRLDLDSASGNRTLTVPLISREIRIGAVRVSRKDPEFVPREIAWVETAATLAAPKIEADRDRRLRHTEPGTGLSTPERLWDRLDEEARRAQRYKTPLALLWIHPSADGELNAARDELTGRLFFRALRDCDLCAQIEPGAFAAVLPDTGRRGATATAMRLLERLQVEMSKNSPAGSAEVDSVIGIAIFTPDDGRPPRSLALRAEAAALSASREKSGWAIDESRP